MQLSSVVYPSSQTYTPTWSAPTPPALNNGTITGSYYQIGKLVWVQVDLIMGAGTTYGTGAYTFTLPTNLPVKTGKVFCGGSYIKITGTSFNTGIPTNVNAGSTSTTVVSIATSIAQGNYVSATLPGTFADTCEIHFTIMYETP